MEEVPETITQYLDDEEIENIKSRRGWAVGAVALVEGEYIDYEENFHEVAYIELFNGEGRAGKFGGVRFMADKDGKMKESYAYATIESFKESPSSVGWVVLKWHDPENPNYREPSP